MARFPYNPTVALRCEKCLKPTAHLLIDFSNNPASALTLVYECQVCGQTKKTFDLNTLPELKTPNVIVAAPLPKEVPEEANKTVIPIEKGPQISR